MCRVITHMVKYFSDRVANVGADPFYVLTHPIQDETKEEKSDGHQNFA